MTAKSGSNDSAYYERRDLLLSELREQGGQMDCHGLALALGWTSAEVRAKLVSLRKDGWVEYDGVCWWRAEDD